jgi:hypothetical protein
MAPVRRSREGFTFGLIGGMMGHAQLDPPPRSQLPARVLAHLLRRRGRRLDLAQCIGNPGAAPRWQWRCGFYPGGRPGECTSGTAADFDEARADFEAAWRVFLAKRTEADFQAA